jgi:cell wall assembly regulator SMI1
MMSEDDRPPYVPLVDRLPDGAPRPTLADQLMDFWRYDGWKGNSPASMEAIEAFEKKCGAKLPQAIREYLLQVNGTSRNWMISDALIGFWSIEEMMTIEEEYGQPRPEDGPVDIVFADHSISIFEYVFRLGDEDPSIWAVRRDGDRWMIAENFAEFVAKFVRDPNSIL